MPISNSVEVKNLSFKYGTFKGAINVLSKLKLDIHKSEFMVLLGPSGCGKTTLAQQLSEQYAIQYFKIDEMYWQENWTLRKSEELCELVAAAIATDRWVIDGHGASAKLMIWQRATHIIWLNYPFVRVFSQMLRRTIQRAWAREVIF